MRVSGHRVQRLICSSARGGAGCDGSVPKLCGANYSSTQRQGTNVLCRKVGLQQARLWQEATFESCTRFTSQTPERFRVKRSFFGEKGRFLGRREGKAYIGHHVRMCLSGWCSVMGCMGWGGADGVSGGTRPRGPQDPGPGTLCGHDGPSPLPPCAVAHRSRRHRFLSSGHPHSGPASEVPRLVPAASQSLMTTELTVDTYCVHCQVMGIPRRNYIPNEDTLVPLLVQNSFVPV